MQRFVSPMASADRFRGFSVNSEPFAGDDLSVENRDGYPSMLSEHKRTAAFEAVAPNLDPTMLPARRQVCAGQQAIGRAMGVAAVPSGIRNLAARARPMLQE